MCFVVEDHFGHHFIHSGHNHGDLRRECPGVISQHIDSVLILIDVILDVKEKVISTRASPRHKHLLECRLKEGISQTSWEGGRERGREGVRMGGREGRNKGGNGGSIIWRIQEGERERGRDREGEGGRESERGKAAFLITHQERGCTGGVACLLVTAPS